MAVLLATAAATLFMTGVGWFVQIVHYPLFASVGADAFSRYHERHSRLTTRVVLGPMVVELAGSALLVIDRPAGVGVAAAWAGLALATATWVSTAALQAPQHRRLTPEGVHTLVAGSWLRTLAWAAHGALVLGMLAAVS